MLHTLYQLFIAPLEFLMRVVLEWGFSWTHSWGWSLVLLSLAVNTAILPIYNRAEGWQEDERALKRKMSRHEAMLRRTFRGHKRFFLLSALRRQFGYGYGFTLRASMGLLLQIPFFFAAYHLLSHFSPLNGQSFGFLSDLGAPDALFSLGGFTVNLLPLVMTGVNLASAFVYTTGQTRRDKIQSYGMALLFLILLYTAPSALTLYWTLNNVYSLGKNIVEKDWMRRSAWRHLRVAWGGVAPRGPAKGRSETARQSFGAWAQGPLVPVRGDNFMPACLMGAVCAVFFWYFIPFCTYLRNPNEFEFNGWELYRQVTPWCLATIIACAALFFASARLLPGVCVKLPWKRESRTCGRASILHAMALSALFALWLEATILSYGLPLLDGETSLFTSRSRMIIDSIVLLDLAFIGIWYWRTIARNIIPLLCIFVALLGASLADMYRGTGEKVDSRTFTPVQGLRIVSKNTLYSQLHFSADHNIVILLVDTLDTPLFEKTIEMYQELKHVFDGFRVFRDNLGPGGYTRIAIPQILSGRTYDGENYFELVQESLVGRNSMAATALDHGYRVYIDSEFWCVKNSERENGENAKNQYIIHLREVMPFFIFRVLPYYFKNRFGSSVNLKNRENNSIEGEDKNKRVFNRVLARINSMTDDPVLQFLYFFGVHAPLIKENAIETTREFIYDFKIFIDVLIEKDIYNKSTIIIMADHGESANRKFINPVFMIKTPDSTGSMTFHDDLMCSIYINRFLKFLYANGFENSAVMDFLKTLPAVRPLYKDGMGKMEARGHLDSLSLTKVTQKPLQDNVIYTLSPDDVQFPCAYPLATKNNDLNTFLGYNEYMNIGYSNINMYFLYGQPRAEKKVTFMIDSWKNNGSIDIYDNNSSQKAHWENHGNVSLNCIVDDKGYINIKFVPQAKQSSAIRYLVVSDASSPAPKLPHYRKEVSPRDRMPHF